jgi:hypothetical protein
MAPSAKRPTAHCLRASLRSSEKPMATSASPSITARAVCAEPAERTLIRIVG